MKLTLRTACVLGLLALPMGCHRKGTMERAGEKADDTAEKAGRSVGNATERAGDKVEDATDRR